MARAGQRWSGLQDALPLLWRAERCGLAARHWIVDALRAFAAEARWRINLECYMVSSAVVVFLSPIIKT